MSVFVQAWVYQHSEARLADRLVLLAIADEADDDGTNAYPSQERIAHKARLSRSTVRRSIENLERSGELVVMRPEVQGRGKFNRYIVCMRKGAQSEHLSERETGQKGPPLGGPDPLTPKNKDHSARTRARSPRDDYFDVLVEELGQPTRTGASLYGQVITEIIEMPDASPEELRRRIHTARELWGTRTFTARAIAKNWPMLGSQAEQSPTDLFLRQINERR